MRTPFLVLCGVLAIACEAFAANKPAPAPAPKKPQPKIAPAKKPLAKPETKPVAAKSKAMPKSAVAGKVPPVVPAPVPPIDPDAGKFSRVNSLGMKFVRVGGIEMCIWPVRVGDFEKYAGADDRRLRKPVFPQMSDHPVVNVSWKDAVKFCGWLTETERALGKLDASLEYRLPMDSEWSVAVGLVNETGESPEDRDLSDSKSYPWGKQWPPPQGAGNFAGAESTTELPIEGYRDEFINTSPVGSFAPNALGLYDMAGNVCQWCRDFISPAAQERTLRGSSWYSGAITVSLLSSCRIKASPVTVNDSYGFRVVVAPVKADDISADGN
jgi:formylglycine-generating enzyme required for sulfatase activity